MLKALNTSLRLLPLVLKMISNPFQYTTTLQLSESPLVVWILFHDAGAVGVGLDEPGEELGVVDLFGEHFLAALSADLLAVGGVEPFLD